MKPVFFNLFKFGANCFLFTARTSLPLQLARYHSTPGITRDFAVSHGLLRQSVPEGESFMNNAGCKLLFFSDVKAIAVIAPVIFIEGDFSLFIFDDLHCLVTPCILLDYVGKTAL